jgi:hypothetical protein
VNIYAVVEGPIGEKKVYAHWAPLVNKDLDVVTSIDAVTDNKLYIIAGGGYPQYFEVVAAGAADVASNPIFDRLVVGIDSEEMTCAEKRQEVEECLDGLGLGISYRVIVQHFCLETWALGNRVIVRRNPRNAMLRRYQGIHDVRNQDPELLPPLQDEQLTRAQFAEKYLRALLNERYRNLSYSKNNPSALLNDKYFERVKERFEDTGHIASFEGFLGAFS